jgi:hypothetical protein
LISCYINVDGVNEFREAAEWILPDHNFYEPKKVIQVQKVWYEQLGNCLQNFIQHSSRKRWQ